MIWAFRCSNMAPSSWTFAINLLPHAEISWGALISLVMLLVSQLYVRAYAQKAAATEAGSSLGSLVWHRHTPRDHKDAKFGWWMVMASVCSMYFWCFSTNMDQFGWTWMVLSQGHQFGKQPEATKLYTFLVNLSNSARYIYIYTWIMLNRLISAQGITVDLCEGGIFWGHDTDTSGTKIARPWMLQKRCNDWTGDPWKISGNNYSNYIQQRLFICLLCSDVIFGYVLNMFWIMQCCIIKKYTNN